MNISDFLKIYKILINWFQTYQDIEVLYVQDYFPIFCVLWHYICHSLQFEQ